MSGDRTYRGGKLTIAWQPHGLIGRVTLDDGAQLTAQISAQKESAP